MAVQERRRALLSTDKFLCLASLATPALTAGGEATLQNLLLRCGVQVNTWSPSDIKHVFMGCIIILLCV